MEMSAYHPRLVAPPMVQLVTIFKGCMPFLSMVFVAMAAIYVFPSLVSWLPEVLYSR